MDASGRSSEIVSCQNTHTCKGAGTRMIKKKCNTCIYSIGKWWREIYNIWWRNNLISIFSSYMILVGEEKKKQKQKKTLRRLLHTYKTQRERQDRRQRVIIGDLCFHTQTGFAGYAFPNRAVFRGLAEETLPLPSPPEHVLV